MKTFNAIVAVSFLSISATAAVLVPAGTTFRVRTDEVIDVDSTQAGMKFRGTLDDPLMIGGTVVVPRGADVVIVAAKVAQGGKFKGSDLVQLKVNSVVVGQRAYPVVTSIAETKSGGEGKKTTRKIAGGTGLGAIIAELRVAARGRNRSACGRSGGNNPLRKRRAALEGASRNPTQLSIAR